MLWSRWNGLHVPEELSLVLASAPVVHQPSSRSELIELALGGRSGDTHRVVFDIPSHGPLLEATVTRGKNGVAVNYADPYMRRRDPDCLVIADGDPTDKTHFRDRFGAEFPPLRQAVLSWLSEQELLLMPFHAGGEDLGYPALLVAPATAAFFAAALADLQGLHPAIDRPHEKPPRAVIYLAPPFRHTHCGGRQIVIHNRRDALHEVFSLNLYPGPSAKKGVYGVLLALGEKEGWITAHGSTVQVITPYDNIVTIMHEGASGGGKSEMLEYPHGEMDGRLLLGENLVTGEKRHLALHQGCALRPVTDDMALCHPVLQAGARKLVVKDAENAWFLRINHITRYGTDPHLERICTQPSEPLIFLNVHAVPQATCLIWEHAEDEPNKPCPNPRVILPRRMVPGIVHQPVEVDVRSFGLRTPPCTREHPSYGILGLLHCLPPALAWLWRLVAPRGHANPSITESDALASEGVGSYWPFATGRRVVHANLLLKQILATPGTQYVLSPNQYLGAWAVGFMPQWIAREYLARRGGARFRPDQLRPARCPLLGYALVGVQVEGLHIPNLFLEIESQPEVGLEGYDSGARQLASFFHRELEPYLAEPDLDPLGRRIIECCLREDRIEAYIGILREPELHRPRTAARMETQDAEAFATPLQDRAHETHRGPTEGHLQCN